MNQNQHSPARHLILMRHAKSDWEDPTLSDFDRPLNARGRDAAPAMAHWLQQTGVLPTRILCSTAARTCETVERMIPCWNDQPTIVHDLSLYLASPETLLNVIASESGDADSVMVVAHNPGMSALVSHFAHESMGMPTAAIAVFEINVSRWADLQSPTQAKLVHFMRPKAL